MATGMSLMLCLLTMKAQRPNAKYVLWSRIDQKSCLKCILSANLIPIIIEPYFNHGELDTDITEFEHQIELLGPENIVCIMSTTSCFAPRGCDNIEELAKLSKEYNIPHIINNAYGLTSTFLTHQIETASRCGRIDVFVQSTDKNLLVPVGGAIVAGFDSSIIEKISKSYVGRGSSSQTLDVFMTLLSLGRVGITKLIKDRKISFNYLMEKMKVLAEKYEQNVLITKRNPISIAMTLNNFENVEMIGSMLFTRGVSGCRVISLIESKTFGDIELKCWGSHRSETKHTTPYLTAAAGLGITNDEIDNFILKLDKIILKMK
jgi:O-phospho-L-seryl-tRNASec:L-selenocysteinyl-tRNA synthase